MVLMFMLWKNKLSRTAVTIFKKIYFTEYEKFA